MKTAVSIPDDVYRAGEKLARRLRIPRSRLYAAALVEYIRQNAEGEITARMNASLKAHPMPVDAFVQEAARRTFERNEWE